MRALRYRMARLACTLVLATTMSVSAQTDDVASEREREAKAEFDAGVAAAHAEDYALAREHFLRSRQLVVKASTLLNLALADLKLGLLEEAAFALDAIEAPAGGPQHDRLRQRARLVRSEIEALRQKGSDANAAASTPGVAQQTAATAADGTHPDVRADALAELPPFTAVEHGQVRGLAPARANEAAAARSEATYSLSGPRALLAVAGAFGAATLGSGLWWREREQAHEVCNHSRDVRCTEQSAIDRQRTAALALTLSLGVATLASTAGGLVWLKKRKQPHAAGASLSLWSGPSTLGLFTRVRF